MSLYNALFGENPFSSILLEALGTSRDRVPRYRDCYLNEKGEIVIHTRTGGGNRGAFEDGNVYLLGLPGYLGDDDDSFDSTYANFRYAVPEMFKNLIAGMKDLGAVSNPAERWQKLLSDLEARDTSNPEVQRALAVGQRIMAQLESDEPGKIIEV